MTLVNFEVTILNTAIVVLTSFKILHSLYYSEKWRMLAQKTQIVMEELEKKNKETIMYKLAWETKNKECEKEKELLRTKQANLWERELYYKQKFHDQNVKNISQFVQANDELKEELEKTIKFNQKLNIMILQARDILSRKTDRIARRITELEKVFKIDDIDDSDDEYQTDDSEYLD